MACNREKKRGRPPQPLETVRAHRIASYVTSSELRELTRIADREGKSLSAAVHDILVSALDGAEPRSTPRR